MPMTCMIVENHLVFITDLLQLIIMVTSNSKLFLWAGLASENLALNGTTGG
jgi:hypothetical protein